MEKGSAEWLFAAQHGSVPHARRLIAQTLDHLPDESLGVVLLLANELMTNAVLHGAGAVGLHLGWDEEGVRLEVTDSSPEVPVARSLDDLDALDGRGLLLVDSLSSDWGVVPMGEGKTVWFTLHAWVGPKPTSACPDRHRAVVSPDLGCGFASERCHLPHCTQQLPNAAPR